MTTDYDSTIAPDYELAQLLDEYEAAQAEARRIQGAWEQAMEAGLPTADEGGWLAERLDDAYALVGEYRRAVQSYRARRLALAEVA